jgi:hypothetical protein
LYLLGQGEMIYDLLTSTRMKEWDDFFNKEDLEWRGV